MPRYINADKFERELKDRYYELEKQFGCYDSYVEAIDECIDKIDNAPTADVQEVKHGKWVLSAESLGIQDVDCVKCSLCGELFIVDEDYDFDYIKDFFIYCPNCGAKMDGKD